MSIRTLFLRLDAPFSAFRWLQAGVYRGTFPVIPPSAAWGLALNLAGIETRGPVDDVVTSIRTDAPHLEIAVGLIRPGRRSTLYQQLHSYPVGSAGREHQVRTFGAKHWIAPVKREILAGLCSAIGVRGETAIVDRIPQGLDGTLQDVRYGLPFAGDNQFLFSTIDVVESTADVRWFVPVNIGERPKESTRLTTKIDRHDTSRTIAPLFAPTSPQLCPDAAWVEVGPAATG